MTSFNYGSKKAKDVGLTCRCYLSNIKPDSMGWGMTQFLFFLGMVFPVFLSIEEMDSALPLQHQWAWGNFKL